MPQSTDVPFEALAEVVAAKLSMVGLNNRGQAGAHESFEESYNDFAVRVDAEMWARHQKALDLRRFGNGEFGGCYAHDGRTNINIRWGRRRDSFATAILEAAARTLGVSVGR